MTALTDKTSNATKEINELNTDYNHAAGTLRRNSKMIRLINFTKFIDKILSGEKCQTIRQPRKLPIKPGDTLNLYTGLRTKDCQLLGTAVCEKIVPIKIEVFDFGHTVFYTHKLGIFNPADDYIKNEISKADGFDNYGQMECFFVNTYKLKPKDIKDFEIIAWKDFKPNLTINTT